MSRAAQRSGRAGAGLGRVLAVAAAAAGVAGALLVGIGALTGGRDAAYGALVGAGIVLGVLGSGAFVVNVVARVQPAAALLVALLTYTLQVVVMGLAFAGLRRSSALGGPLDARWLAGAVVAGTVTWVVTQLVLTTRQRIPAYQPVVGSGATPPSQRSRRQ